MRAQDSMISETEVLENGDGKHRCQVVRWMRTFPFSFISKREYVIARRMWRGADGALYGITKVRIDFSICLDASTCLLQVPECTISVTILTVPVSVVLTMRPYHVELPRCCAAWHSQAQAPDPASFMKASSLALRGNHPLCCGWLPT